MKIKLHRVGSARLAGLVAAVVASVSTYGCGENAAAGARVSVSVQRASPARGFHIEAMTDETYLKAERKAANRGSLAGAFDPELFTLDLDEVQLYSRTDPGHPFEAILPHRRNPYGTLIPRQVNILRSNGFIREFSVSAPRWDGICLQFLPGVGDSSGLPYRSLVAVRLPSAYDGLALANEEARSAGQEPGIHYFSFQGLQPYVGTFLSYLVIGADVTSPGIQNPGGLMPSAVGDSSWSLPGGETTGNTTAVFLPGPAIDFTGFANPEIVLFWDTDDLIQVWDRGTADLADDFATFDLAAPFPVSLSLREKAAATAGAVGDVTPPGEAILPAIGQSPDASGPAWNTLVWTNPEDPDFDKALVVRKAGSAPTGKADGDTVYEGFEPNFVDTTGLSGTTYWYALYMVDTAGNRSAGTVLSSTQP